jgi:hypothetical protein
MTETTAGRRKGYYGLFGLAATIYTAGVVAFAGWSYVQQRNNLLSQVDQSLIHATHATEQILGNVFIECAVTTDTAFESGHAHSQDNLNRFAEDCHFGILGAVAYKDGKQWELISGGQNNTPFPAEAPCLQELMSARLPPMISNMARTENGSTRIHTLDLEQCGEIRIAIRYNAISGDAGYAIFVARNMTEVNHLISTLALRSVGIGIFLYVMAFPLIVLYNFAQAKSSRETADLHEMLQRDYATLKERESELEDAIRDLERFNTVAIGRESRIIELKAEVNTLLEQMKQQKRYSVDHVE